MNTARSTEELIKQIEQVVESYVADSRRVAREALERAFGSTADSTKTQRTRANTSTNSGSPIRAARQRRSQDEVARLAERLCDAVQERPGESMVGLAAELEVEARLLELPVKLLRREGRVRTVGQRQATRYFPAVASKRTS